jgi:two-component system, OmpR family, phosphate regulon sensor histidine kinase PhoR
MTQRGLFARLFSTRSNQALVESANQNAGRLEQVVDELRAETGLREQILRAMKEGVILTEGDGRLVYANPAAAEFFGKDNLDSLPPQLSRPESDFTMHHPVRRDLRAESFDLEEGRRLFVVQDVTEAKRIDDMRRDFVANASHELKTPVSGVLATAETIEAAWRDDPQAAGDFAVTLVKEATRLSALVDDLLDLARLERDDENLEPVRLAGVVKGEVESVRPRALEKSISLSADLDENIEVHGHPQDLALMVRNLLDNAVNYTSQGEIRVRLINDANSAVLEVTDTGIGITTADRARIFERFYRADKARSRESGGTGLGLSIVRHVAETHGGTVSVASELLKGSTFTIHLPISRG